MYVDGEWNLSIMRVGVAAKNLHLLNYDLRGGDLVVEVPRRRSGGADKSDDTMKIELCACFHQN